MAISAAVDGLVFAWTACRWPSRNSGTGKLVIPFAGDVMTVQGHGFVALRSKTDLPKIRIFREWLFDELGKTHEWSNQFLASEWQLHRAGFIRPGLSIHL